MIAVPDPRVEIEPSREQRRRRRPPSRASQAAYALGLFTILVGALALATRVAAVFFE